MDIKYMSLLDFIWRRKMFINKKSFAYYLVLIGLFYSGQAKSSNVFDAVDMDYSAIQRIRSCVVNKDNYDYIVRNESSNVIARLSNFQDKNFVVIVPNFSSSFFDTEKSERRSPPLGRIKKSYNSFSDQLLPLLEERLSELRPQNIVFSGSGHAGSVSLLLATILQKHLHDEQGKVKAVVFSPNSMSEGNFIRAVHNIIEPKNILFFTSKSLFKITNSPSFPGTPIEVLPWEDSFRTVPRNAALVAGLYTAYVLLPKIYSSERSDVFSDPYSKYAALSWSSYIFLRLLEAPYVPSDNVLKVAFSDFQHHWQYRHDGIENDVFPSEREALLQSGQVSLWSQTRNPLVYYTLKLFGGY